MVLNVNKLGNTDFNDQTIFNTIYYNFRFQELRRDLQTVISTRTNFNIMHIEDYGGETFLSEYVATSLIQEFNQALDRCCTVFIIYIIDFIYFFLNSYYNYS